MYRITKFGRQSLEHYNQLDDIGTGETPTNHIPLIGGGALDGFGSMQKHPGVVERVLSRRLRAANVDDLTDLYQTFLSLRGKRDRLFRRTSSGLIQWMYARLVALDAQRDYQRTQFLTMQDLELRFATQEAFWRGKMSQAWTLDSGYYLDEGLYLDSAQIFPLSASPAQFNVIVGSASDPGRAPVRALRLSISAGSSAMSNLTIVRAGGEAISWVGTILANKELLIDTGTMQITNDGADAYSGASFLPTADMASWLTLQPGSNQITIAYSGGGTGKQAEFEYFEGWY